MPDRFDLPAGFRRGAAVAAYRIEEEADEDGRDPSSMPVRAGWE